MELRGKAGFRTVPAVAALAALAVFVALAAMFPAHAQAATWKYAERSWEALSFSNGKVWVEGSDLYSSCSGETVLLAKKVKRDSSITSEPYASNGTLVYFTKGKYVKCVNVDGTGLENVLKIGKTIGTYAFQGKYIYCGHPLDEKGAPLYIVNLATGKASRLLKSCLWYTLEAKNGYLVASTGNASALNRPLYLLKASGAAKKRVGKGGGGTIKGNKVRYNQFKAGGKMYRQCTYSIKTGKTTRSKWRKQDTGGAG